MNNRIPSNHPIPPNPSQWSPSQFWRRNSGAHPFPSTLRHPSNILLRRRGTSGLGVSCHRTNESLYSTSNPEGESENSQLALDRDSAALQLSGLIANLCTEYSIGNPHITLFSYSRLQPRPLFIGRPATRVILARLKAISSLRSL